MHTPVVQAAARAEKKAARAAAASAGGSGRVHMAMPAVAGMHSARRERNSFKHRRLFTDAPGALKARSAAVVWVEQPGDLTVSNCTDHCWLDPLDYPQQHSRQSAALGCILTTPPSRQKEALADMQLAAPACRTGSRWSTAPPPARCC